MNRGRKRTARTSRRPAALLVTWVLVGAALPFLAGGSATAQTEQVVDSIEGEAIAIFNSILVPINPGVPPAPNAPPAPAAAHVSDPPENCPTEDHQGADVLATDAVQATLLEAEVRCFPDLPHPNGHVESVANIAGVTLESPDLPEGAPPILDAQGVHAECRSGRLEDGTLGSEGNATIATLSIGEQDIDVVSLPKNTTLNPLPGVTLILNEQIGEDDDLTDGDTSITVNAIHLIIEPEPAPPIPPLPAGELIVGHVECAATVTQITTTTTGPPGTTTPPEQTTTTLPAATTTTLPAATTTTAPPLIQTVPAAAPAAAPPAPAPAAPAAAQPPGQLARTGLNPGPLVIYALFSVVVGILLIRSNGGARIAPLGPRMQPLKRRLRAPRAENAPASWGPAEIGHALWCAAAAAILQVGRMLTRRGRRRS